MRGEKFAKKREFIIERKKSVRFGEIDIYEGGILIERVVGLKSLIFFIPYRYLM